MPRLLREPFYEFLAPFSITLSQSRLKARIPAAIAPQSLVPANQSTPRFTQRGKSSKLTSRSQLRHVRYLDHDTLTLTSHCDSNSQQGSALVIGTDIRPAFRILLSKQSFSVIADHCQKSTLKIFPHGILKDGKTERGTRHIGNSRKRRKTHRRRQE